MSEEPRSDEQQNESSADWLNDFEDYAKTLASGDDDTAQRAEGVSSVPDTFVPDDVPAVEDQTPAPDETASVDPPAQEPAPEPKDDPYNEQMLMVARDIAGLSEDEARSFPTPQHLGKYLHALASADPVLRERYGIQAAQPQPQAQPQEQQAPADEYLIGAFEPDWAAADQDSEYDKTVMKNFDGLQKHFRSEFTKVVGDMQQKVNSALSEIANQIVRKSEADALDYLIGKVSREDAALLEKFGGDIHTAMLREGEDAWNVRQDFYARVNRLMSENRSGKSVTELAKEAVQLMFGVQDAKTAEQKGRDDVRQKANRRARQVQMKPVPVRREDPVPLREVEEDSREKAIEAVERLTESWG